MFAAMYHTPRDVSQPSTFQGDILRDGWLWEGFRESRRCSRDTYLESYTTEYALVYEEKHGCVSGEGPPSARPNPPKCCGLKFWASKISGFQLRTEGLGFGV